MRTYGFDSRDAQIIKMRAQGHTYHDIGKVFDITRERVRQILDKHGKAGRRKLSPLLEIPLDKDFTQQ